MFERTVEALVVDECVVAAVQTESRVVAYMTAIYSIIAASVAKTMFEMRQVLRSRRRHVRQRAVEAQVVDKR